jgi:putative phage-type endonuclease
MKIIECEQNSPQWFAARCGIPTASNFDLIITVKGERSKQREKYLYQLAGERIIRASEESYQSEAMLRGIEMESEGREFYQLITGYEVTQTGFCITDDDSCGASPDSLVNTDGLLEIKCPKLATHIGYLLSGTLPSDYFQQTQGQLFVTGRKWVDFLSYYPGLKPLLLRVYPDKIFQIILEKEIKLFCADLNEVIKKIQ